MVAQILAYLVIIGITTISAIQMIKFADYIKSDKIICKVLCPIIVLLGIITAIIPIVITCKCLCFCWSIIF